MTFQLAEPRTMVAWTGILELWEHQLKDRRKELQIQFNALVERQRVLSFKLFALGQFLRTMGNCGVRACKSNRCSPIGHFRKNRADLALGQESVHLERCLAAGRRMHVGPRGL